MNKRSGFTPILLLVIILIIGSIGLIIFQNLQPSPLNPPSPSNTSETDWKIYENYDYRFRLKYPSSWYITSLFPKGEKYIYESSQLIISDHPYFEGEDNSKYIQVIVTPIYESIEKYLDDTEGTLIDTKYPIENIEINGQKTIKRTEKLANSQYNRIKLYTPRNIVFLDTFPEKMNIYRFKYDEDPKKMEIYKKISESLEFIEENEQTPQVRDSIRKKDLSKMRTSISLLIARTIKEPDDPLEKFPKTATCIGTGSNCFNLEKIFVPKYIDKIPVDPVSGSSEDSRYKIYANLDNFKIVLSSTSEVRPETEIVVDR